MKLHIFHEWSKWEYVGTHTKRFFYGLSDNEQPYKTMPILTFKKKCNICNIEKFKEVKTG
ncbi:MAG: hypothetical protein K0R66_1733 [Gammaproteobacteria bacterium]|jgi:hypothetical protein|nr:hypothetical protein [Gammaproteobacteria bacterium]